jgi:hypothetical protein
MNKILLLCIIALLPLAASATYVPGLDVTSGYDIMISTGSCPAGFTEDTAMRGFYAVGNTATGTVGNSLGTAMTGTTIPDVSYTPAGTNGTVSITPLGTVNTPTYTVTGTLFVTTAGATAAATAINGTTIASGANTVTDVAHTFTGSSTTVGAETFTGTANTTLRSSVSPGKQVMFCKKT